MWEICCEKLAEHLPMSFLVFGKCNGGGLTGQNGGRLVNEQVGPQDNGLLS